MILRTRAPSFFLSLVRALYHSKHPSRRRSERTGLANWSQRHDVAISAAIRAEIMYGHRITNRGISFFVP